METIKVGINGFGRIGKCTFLQLLENPKFEIKVVNTSLSINSIQRYINRDSSHHCKQYKVDIMFELASLTGSSNEASTELTPAK